MRKNSGRGCVDMMTFMTDFFFFFSFCKHEIHCTRRDDVMWERKRGEDGL